MSTLTVGVFTRLPATVRIYHSATIALGGELESWEHIVWHRSGTHRLYLVRLAHGPGRMKAMPVYSVSLPLVDAGCGRVYRIRIARVGQDLPGLCTP